MASSSGALELDIHTWRPPVPDGFTTRFTSTEVAHMISQAQAMPTAALLVVHRLRHPLGARKCGVGAGLEHPDPARHDAPCHWEGPAVRRYAAHSRVPGAAGRGIDGAVAAAHVQSPIGEYSWPYHERIKRVMAVVWEARRRFTTLYWYHLGAVMPPFSQCFEMP
ncbi:Fatty-acid amide hydrolase [Tolypocladium paradoxum]|uniref:Fatty-acid amide hydrolase n=1 Tax=Tolypocladium paradoxum TaxID=94208 RepID=A0A2S4KSE0_9HYPO|nr:Fatty-acid amide hydrolase [Tolypocladium paradoxum]